MWSTELSQYLFGIFVPLSGGYLLLEKGHVNVDIVTSKLSAKTCAYLDIFTSILFFIFASLLLYYGSKLAIESISLLETSQSAWDVPIWPVKITIPIGAFLLLLQGIAKLLRDILTVVTNQDPLKDPIQSKETL